MAAVLNPEGKGEAHLQVNPVLRNYELEIEMLETGEQHLSISISNHQPLLRVRANAKDVMRKDILTQRNYHKSDAPEYLRRRPLSRTIPDVSIPAGYKVRDLGSKMSYHCAAGSPGRHSILMNQTEITEAGNGISMYSTLRFTVVISVLWLSHRMASLLLFAPSGLTM